LTKDIFISLLTIHVLCEFYFLPQKAAHHKKSEILWELLYCAIYAFVAMIIIWLMIPGLWPEYILCFVAGHVVIDIGKYFICKCKIGENISLLKHQQYIFVAGQLFHILIILAIAYLLRDIDEGALYNAQYIKVLGAFGVSGTVVISWFIKILLIHKPANILISGILSQYKPIAKEAEEASDKNTGRFIGTLERTVMVILMSINQYSAVGFVLTAKSIARYDRISKEQEFAEYYLLGTLFSTICAIVVSLIF